MEETFMLVMLVLVMLFGSFFAGNIPLIFNWSKKKLNIITVLGAGLLIGTALTVTIPEGMNVLYKNSNLCIKAPTNSSGRLGQQYQHDDEYLANQSSTIGLSLVLGFIFMMLVDQIVIRSNSRSSISCNFTATLGIVVHAAVDGVALGAAATTKYKDVEMIVFLAIMFHKAPTAFGLASYLLHQDTDKQCIRKHLIVFSLSAPLFTLITYFGIGQEQKETVNSVTTTGIAMLFSGGTFLYVATVHVLPELNHDSRHHQKRSTSSGSSSSVEYSHFEDSVKGYSGLGKIELLILVFGALLPSAITMGNLN